ncbi:phosphatidylglycerol lysyltransferase domain-containing protein [Alienimonas sp. DA493]|uniref:phosphatidylglycerol lysyltransferase domain-containing protein n=1 Tax=Alienimonas sp. DA493 TaxID=3373605 RepID=UPI0037545481
MIRARPAVCDADPRGGEDPVGPARRLALDHARTADGLLVGEPGRRLLWRADLPGAVGLVIGGGTALIPGGPLCEPRQAPTLIAAVGSWCAAFGVTPLWLNVTDAELPPLRAAGYRPTRTGSECVVRHPGEWAGSRYRAVRAACARAERAGLALRELEGGEPAWGDLPAVFAAHLAAKPQRRPAGPFIAPPPRESTEARRVWIAEAGRRIVGFATAHPLGRREADGSRRWTLGAFHTRPDAPPGTAAALVRGLLDALAAEGIGTVSLGPAPAVVTGAALPGENPLVLRGVRAWFRAGNGVFDARGLWHFKSRFRPTLEPLYACGKPRVTVRQAADFVRASGVLRVAPGRALRGTWADLRRPKVFGALP